MDLLQAMGAVTDDRARLRRRCRRNDLPDDGHLLLDDRRRLPEMLLVVRPSDEAEHQDQGHGENPVDQAGDDGADADDPERGRDEVEEDEDPDARFASPMQPLRPVHRGTILGGIRIPEPLVRALLESRDRIARDEHDAKEDLRILRDVKGSEVDRVARYTGGIPCRAVRQELAPWRPDQIDPAAVHRGAPETQGTDEVVRIRLDDFPGVTSGSMDVEVSNVESRCGPCVVRVESQAESRPLP